MNLSSSEMQRLRDVATALRERIISRAAQNADAPAAVREALSDMIGYCRSIERACDFITTELQRTK